GERLLELIFLGRIRSKGGVVPRIAQLSAHVVQQEIAVYARHFTQLLPMAHGAAGRFEKFTPFLKIGVLGSVRSPASNWLWQARHKIDQSSTFLFVEVEARCFVVWLLRHPRLWFSRNVQTQFDGAGCKHEIAEPSLLSFPAKPPNSAVLKLGDAARHFRIIRELLLSGCHEHL